MGMVKGSGRRRMVVSGAVVGVVGLLALLLWPDPLRVDTVAVREGALEVVVEAEGYSQVRERFIVAAPVSGMVQRLAYREGDRVKAGEVVAAMVPVPLDTRQFETARSQRESARAALVEARERERRIELLRRDAALREGRYRKLFAEGAIAREEYEGVQNAAVGLERQHDEAVAGVRRASQDLEAAGAMVDRQLMREPFRVVSPVDGRVLVVHEKSERVVTAGSPLLTLGDTGALEVVVDVLSADAVAVRPGNSVRIENWGGGRVLHGVVERVAPMAFTKLSALGIEEKRVNVVIRIAEPDARLGDNFRVQASIVVASSPKVLQVPLSSLFRGKKGWQLFVVDHDRAVVRDVVIGLRGMLDAAVVSGVSAGERVVVHPPGEVADGLLVRESQ